MNTIQRIQQHIDDLFMCRYRLAESSNRFDRFQHLINVGQIWLCPAYKARARLKRRSALSESRSASFRSSRIISIRETDDFADDFFAAGFFTTAFFAAGFFTTAFFAAGFFTATLFAKGLVATF